MDLDPVQRTRDTWPHTSPEERVRMIAHPQLGLAVREAGLSLDDPYRDGSPESQHLDRRQAESERATEEIPRAGPEIHLTADEIEDLLVEDDTEAKEAVARLRWVWPHLRAPERENQIAWCPRKVAAAGVGLDDPFDAELFDPEMVSSPDFEPSPEEEDPQTHGDHATYDPTIYDPIRRLRDTWPDTEPEEREWMITDPRRRDQVREAGLSLDDPYSEWLAEKLRMERVIEEILGAGPEIHLTVDEDETDYVGLDNRDLRGGIFHTGGLDWSERQTIEWMLEETEDTDAPEVIETLRWAWPHLRAPEREAQIARRPRAVAAAEVHRDDPLDAELYTPDPV